MSSHNAMNPTEGSACGANGGAIMRRIIELARPKCELTCICRHVLLVFFKELWVNIHYPATAR